MNPLLIPSLKQLLLEATEKTEPTGGLHNDEVLFGPEARLELDSLDALQISMAIHKQFGVRMADSKDTRRAMQSLNTLANFLNTHPQFREPRR